MKKHKRKKNSKNKTEDVDLSTSEVITSSPDKQSIEPGKTVSKYFEKWKLVISIAQTVILFFTFLTAFYIGFKQNEINKNLLDLNFTLSVEISYDHKNERINIINKGRTNIFLWGSRLNNGAKEIEKEPRLIVPGGFYYLLTDRLKKLILQKVGQNVETTMPLDLFIETSNHRKYTVKNLLLVKAVDYTITIHVQTLSVFQSDWSQ